MNNAVAAETTATSSITTSVVTPIETSLSDPILATYDGGSISLRKLEEYTREMPLVQRIPFAKGAGQWRRSMCGQFAQSVALTSQALVMGLQNDAGYLRARDYFIQEYMCYLVLRDELNNRMDISPQLQQHEYETHKSDFWLSPTVTLRTIRTRDKDAVSSVATALKNGADFVKLEMEYSQVSPRYRGQVVGPFPKREDHTIIPPPDEVIAAASELNEGETTGPLKVGPFWFFLKTEDKVPGRQQTLDEVAEQVEERLRSKQSQQLLPALITQIQTELGVVVDEELFASGTRADDLLATIGALKIYRSEYTDLNGNVRGPATAIANMMPTDLKRFVLPYMISQWGRLHGLMDRKETQKAIHYYDLQHLAAKVAMALGDKLMPPPTDEQLRERFERNIDEFRTPQVPEPRFEDHKQDMINALMQTRVEEATHKVTQLVLSKLNFQMKENPVCKNITALEALAAAKDQLPSDARLLEIAPSRLPGGPNAATLYEDIGRAPQWIITYDSPETKTTSILINGPQPLLNDESDYAMPAFEKLKTLLRFDTNSLKRHAVDKGLGDFMAKHNNQVQTGAAIRVFYSDDDPTSPTDCLIVYSAQPVDDSGDDGFLIKYTGYEGEITKRRLGEVEGECPTCPQSDLPSPLILDAATSKPSTTKPYLKKGDS